MRRLLLLVAVAASGCGPDDPTIKAERTVIMPGGGVSAGPVGGGYQHGGQTERYEGPASLAPAWTK